MMTASIKQLFQSEYSLWFRKALINQSLGGYFELINQGICRSNYMGLAHDIWRSFSWYCEFQKEISLKKRHCQRCALKIYIIEFFLIGIT